MMPSRLSGIRVLLSNIWFDLQAWILVHWLFSLSYYRILPFPTCRHFFLPKCGSLRIHRKGHDEVRNYQFPPPAVLSLTRIWYLVFEIETAYREIEQAVTESCSAPLGLATLCMGAPAREEVGRRICRSEHCELVCSMGFRWQVLPTEGQRVVVDRMCVYFVELWTTQLCVCVCLRREEWFLLLSILNTFTLIYM